MIKVVIIDDNKISRLGIRSFLADDEIEIIGEATDGESGIKLVLEEKPDIVMLDLYLPDVLGIQVCQTIANMAPQSKVIFISGATHLFVLSRLLHTSAKGLISKDMSFSGVEAVKTVYQGKTYVQPDLAYELLHFAITQKTGYYSLKEKERLVLMMAAEGKTHNQIAKILLISTKTVTNVKFRAMKKLGIKKLDQVSDIFSIEAFP